MPLSAAQKEHHKLYMRAYLRRKSAEDPSFKERTRKRSYANELKRKAALSPLEKEEKLKKRRVISRRKNATTSGWVACRIRAIKSRCKGMAFNIGPEDLHVPALCPVLGIPLVLGAPPNADTCPSVDRIDPSRGYTKGNVRVISYRANLLKNNATLDEHRLVYEDARRIRGVP